MTLGSYIPYNNHHKGGIHNAKRTIIRKNTTMSFAIQKYLKAEISIIAQKENRSMSNLIVSLLTDYANLYKRKERLTRYYELISEMKDDEQ